MIASAPDGTFWRHDVDYSLAAAERMAAFERSLGVSSTYYLMFAPQACPFYSQRDALASARRLEAMGHRVGDHIDERRCVWRDGFPALWGEGLLVSWHCPTDRVLWRDFPGVESAYAPAWRGRYLADSLGRFRYGDPEDHPAYADGPIQINTHPEWWWERGWHLDVDPDMHRRFFGCDPPEFVDYRRGRPVRSGERDVWAFDPRPGSIHACIHASPETYTVVLGRGYAIVDGQLAHAVEAECDEESGWIRLRFDKPYEAPQ